MGMTIFFIVFILLNYQVATAQIPQKNYVLSNVNLFNGIDNKIFPNSLIFIKAGNIERIGKAGDIISSDYEVINCEGNYASPGMIDAHAHIDNMESMKRAITS